MLIDKIDPQDHHNETTNKQVNIPQPKKQQTNKHIELIRRQQQNKCKNNKREGKQAQLRAAKETTDGRK